MVYNSSIKVIATQLIITCCSQNFNYTITYFKNRYVKSTTTKVINHNLFILFLIQTKSKSSSSRLIDNSLNIQTCNLTCILCCLTLCVSKISRNSNYSIIYICTQISLCISLQLTQNNCRNLLWSILLTVNIHTISATHMTLNRTNSSMGISYSLSTSSNTYNTLTCL